AEVIINHAQRRYFSALWGASNLTVSGRAVARGQWINGTPSPNNNIGILVLGQPTNNAPVLSENGNVGINMPNTAALAVNDPNHPFRTAGGQAEITAGSFIFGAATGNLGQPPILNGPSPTYSTQTADPLSGLTPPSSSGLAAQSYTGQSTLNPGIYTG